MISPWLRGLFPALVSVVVCGEAWAQDAPTAPADPQATPAQPAPRESASAPEAASAEGSASAAPNASADVNPAAAAVTAPAPKAASASPAPAPAPAQVAPSEAPVAPSFDPRELGRHQRQVGLQLGLRTRFVDDPALDPFAEEDAVAAFSVALGMTALTLDRSSLVVMAGWEAGGTTADARGDQASLTTNRLWVAPELRHHLWPTLYVFARPALGAVRTRAELDSASMGAEFSGTAWAASFELSAGLAYEVFGARDPNAKRARGWVLVDGGYGWSGATHLELDAEDSLRAAPLDLGDLHWRGGQFGVHLALTY